MIKPPCFFEWRAENRIKNKSGFIFAAIVALFLAKELRQGAVVTAIKKMQFNVQGSKLNLRPSTFICEPSKLSWHVTRVCRGED